MDKKIKTNQTLLTENSKYTESEIETQKVEKSHYTNNNQMKACIDISIFKSRL